MGAYFSVDGDWGMMSPELFDPILQLHKENITDFAFHTMPLDNRRYGTKEVSVSDKARISQEESYIVGV